MTDSKVNRYARFAEYAIRAFGIPAAEPILNLAEKELSQNQQDALLHRLRRECPSL